MESFVVRFKNVLVLSLVVLLQVIGLAIQVRRHSPNGPDSGGVRFIRSWMNAIISPPERLVRATGSGIRGVWNNYFYLRDVRQQNHDLQTEISRLRLEQAGLLEDARQGQRLQELLSFKKKYIYQTVPAQVIGTSGSLQSHILSIDKGSKDGIKPDMAVITPDGIVGKTRDVFAHSAQVLLINDQSSGAGVVMEDTRIRGVLRGNADGQPQIINLMPDSRIQPGERVLTSGGDQIFPRGLHVGIVDHIVRDQDRPTFIDVVIRPDTNLARLEEVLVITTTGDTMTAQERKDLALSEQEAIEAKKSASDVLSERLPSVHDPNAPPPTAAALAAADATTVPPPPRPAQPLHPDHYSPNAVPPAGTLTPGQRYSADRTYAKPPAPQRPAAPAGSSPTGSTLTRSAPAGSAPAGTQTGLAVPRPVVRPPSTTAGAPTTAQGESVPARPVVRTAPPAGLASTPHPAGSPTGQPGASAGQPPVSPAVHPIARPSTTPSTSTAAGSAPASRPATGAPAIPSGPVARPKATPSTAAGSAPAPVSRPPANRPPAGAPATASVPTARPSTATGQPTQRPAGNPATQPTTKPSPAVGTGSPVRTPANRPASPASTTAGSTAPRPAANPAATPGPSQQTFLPGQAPARQRPATPTTGSTSTPNKAASASQPAGSTANPAAKKPSAPSGTAPRAGGSPSQATKKPAGSAPFVYHDSYYVSPPANGGSAAQPGAATGAPRKPSTASPATPGHTPGTAQSKPPAQKQQQPAPQQQ